MKKSEYYKENLANLRADLINELKDMIERSKLTEIRFNNSIMLTDHEDADFDETIVGINTESNIIITQMNYDEGAVEYDSVPTELFVAMMEMVESGEFEPMDETE